jgi:hypothetical protein
MLTKYEEQNEKYLKLKDKVQGVVRWEIQKYEVKLTKEICKQIYLLKDREMKKI